MSSLYLLIRHKKCRVTFHTYWNDFKLISHENFEKLGTMEYWRLVLYSLRCLKSYPLKYL